MRLITSQSVDWSGNKRVHTSNVCSGFWAHSFRNLEATLDSCQEDEKERKTYCILCNGCILMLKFRTSLDRGRPCRAQSTRGQRREHLQLQSGEDRPKVVRQHSRWPLFGGCTSPSNWSVFLRPISWWVHTGERQVAKCFWSSRPTTGSSNMARCGSGAPRRPDKSENEIN